jgi:hypothetical protein
MGFFSSIAKVFKKVLPIAAAAVGIATGVGAIAGAGIFAGAGATAATGLFAGVSSAFSGITSALGAFGSSPLGGALKVGGTLLNAFGSYQQASSQADVFGVNAGIAATNAAELQALFGLQSEAIDTQITSTKEAGDIREEEIANKRARSLRSAEFGKQSIARDQSILSLGTTGITQRRDINQKIIAATITNIDAQAAERQRQLNEQKADLVGNARSTAAAAGLRVDSQHVRQAIDLIDRETNYAKDLAAIEASIERGNTVRRGEIDISEASQRLGEITQQYGELDQKSVELQAALDDALFDADLELKISQRNESIAIDRAEFEKKILAKRNETSIAVANAQEQQFLNQQQASNQASFINPLTIVAGLIP